MSYPTEPCRYDHCPGTAILGRKRYNATRTAMNRKAMCQTCGRVMELSTNLTLVKKGNQ